MTHNRVKCDRDVRGTQYVGKGYKSKFTCSTCGASCWQHLSYLGSRHVVCTGDKFLKVDRQEWADSLQDELDHAAAISQRNPTR
jgi:hypothetical protein